MFWKPSCTSTGDKKVSALSLYKGSKRKRDHVKNKWKRTLLWRSRICITSKCVQSQVRLDLSIPKLRFLLRVRWFFWLFLFLLYYIGQGTGMKPHLSNIWPWAREFGPGGLLWELKTSTQPPQRSRCYWKYLQEELSLLCKKCEE